MFVLDSITHFKKIGEMYVLDTKTNSITDDLLIEFQEKYTIEGWKLISGTSKFIIFVSFILSILFLNSENPYYKTVLTFWPSTFAFWVFLDKAFESSKLIRRYSFYIMLVLSGFSVIYDSFNKPSFKFNELWMPHALYSIYLWIFSFMNWRKLVLISYLIKISFLIVMNFCFEDIPLETYIAFICTCIFFPIIWMLISLKVKEILTLLKSNKELIHTIQKILQAFPEGVIIRSLDKRSMQTILKFANNIANKDLITKEKSEGKSQEINIKVFDHQNINLDSDPYHLISLDEFLDSQERKCELENPLYVDQMILVKKSIESIWEEFARNQNVQEVKEEILFNVKSIKVNWEGKEDSFMHVFINTTQVKKLEEERANREYQHMMFASLSHELRTPLNAFSNSLILIRFTFNEIKSSFEKCPEISDKVEPLYPRFYKFIKIGEVSSYLLMNLVDDILDMSKFEAKTFQLNINQFKMGDLLKDIDYIFGFQWAEKHLDFKIDCSDIDLEKSFRSDHKRIKQVLINLVSNSLKFTEKGKIRVKVNEFEHNEEQFLKFVVSDTGVGISKQDIPKLFKMFGMLSKHKNKLNPSGSGIGLSISKMIVESLGGKIKVSSCENISTKFTFTVKNMIDEIKRSEESKQENFENNPKYLSKEESKLQQLNDEVKIW